MQQLIDAIAKSSTERGAEVEPLTENPTKEEILEDFRQAWHEAMTGQKIPVSELWEEIG